MKDGAVIVTGVGVGDKIFDTDRGFGAVELEKNFTEGGFDLDQGFITHGY
jgi:hypothetical protein